MGYTIPKKKPMPKPKKPKKPTKPKAKPKSY
jgi:hypothetical protein